MTHCSHPHKNSSIQGTDRSMRSPIVMETHLSCSNVEKSTGWGGGGGGRGRGGGVRVTTTTKLHPSQCAGMYD